MLTIPMSMQLALTYSLISADSLMLLPHMSKFRQEGGLVDLPGQPPDHHTCVTSKTTLKDLSHPTTGERSFQLEIGKVDRPHFSIPKRKYALGTWEMKDNQKSADCDPAILKRTIRTGSGQLEVLQVRIELLSLAQLI